MKLHSLRVLTRTVSSVAKTGGMAWRHYGLIGMVIAESVNDVLL